MALPAWLGGILSGGFSVVKEWVAGWQQRKVMKLQHKTTMERIKIEGTETRALMDKEQEVAWDKHMSAGSMTSWKDEFWTIVLAIPMIGCFIPKLAPHIMNGFEVLQQTPDWYKAAVGLAIGAAFGYRKFADWNMRKFTKRQIAYTNGGPDPKPHKSFRLTKKSFVEGLKDELKDAAEDIKEELTDKD